MMLGCAYVKEAGHRGINATMEQCLGCCVSFSARDDAKENVQDCFT